MRRNGKPTLAFLNTQFTRNTINRALWLGVYETCRARDVNVVCLPINPLLMRQSNYSMANVLLNLMTPENFDGLVIWGSGLTNQADPDAVRAFFEKAARFPAVNISLSVPGIPAVFVDSRSGLHAVCDHLVERHGLRRLGFIGGPPDHAEAAVRLAAYRESLAAHGLAYDPALVTTGDFSTAGGLEGARRILDAAPGGVEALVCANDLMAFGAALEADARGLIVPADLAVTGFDDLDECLDQNAPLTTVTQPFREMGEKATLMLLDRLAGRPVADVEYVPSRLVVRESCGCREDARPERRRTGRPRSLKRGRIADLACAELAAPDRREPDTLRKLESLGAALADGLAAGDEAVFTRAFEVELAAAENGTAVTDLGDCLQALQTAVADHASEGAWRWRAEKLLARARLALVERGHRLGNRVRLRDEYEDEQFQYLVYRLIASFNMDEFMGSIRTEFPRLGIRECCFALYTMPTDGLSSPESLVKSICVLALPDGRSPSVAPRLPDMARSWLGEPTLEQTAETGPAGNGTPFEFASDEIFPDRLSGPGGRFAYIVVPLYFERQSLGFVVFGEPFKPVHLYTTLQRVLSASLKGALLMQEQERLFGALEARARDLQRLTEQLTASNRELEQFASVASHDLKEPVRKMLVFSGRLRETCAAALDERGLDFLSRMEKTAARMEALITSLLDYSRLSTSSKPFEPVDLKALVANVLEDLEVALEKKQAVIDVGDLPEIEADPSQLRQLFHNIVSNAVKFQAPGNVPRVRIDARPAPAAGAGTCEITVTDNGIGIEAKHFQTIFGIFQRLHGPSEFEGTGIGLAVCKKVVDRHGGSIRVTSEPGHGTTFIIALPIAQS